jgi:hypothetical protein
MLQKLTNNFARMVRPMNFNAQKNANLVALFVRYLKIRQIDTSFFSDV